MSRETVSRPTDGGPICDVDLKWSLWSRDLGVWGDYAPQTLQLIREYVRGDASETGDRLVVSTAPRKEIRYGRVAFTHVPNEDAFLVDVSFDEEWDDASDLLDVLELEAEDEPALREALPYVGEGRSWGSESYGWGEASPGVSVLATKTFKYGTRLATVMKWIDDQEDELIRLSEKSWEELKAGVKKEE